MLLRRPALSPTPNPGSTHEILLMRRAGTGFMDGYFGLPGGHLEAGELPAQAAMRECSEEAGVLVEQLHPLAVLPYRSRTSLGVTTGFNFIFLATNWSGSAHIAEPGQCDLMCWVPPPALPQPYPDWLDSVLLLEPKTGWYQELDYT